MKKIFLIIAGLLVGLAVLGVAGTFIIGTEFEKFEGKARQSEAKHNLIALYSYMKAQQAEFDTFGTSDLDGLIHTFGRGNPEHRYLVGFTQPFFSGNPQMMNVDPERRWFGNTNPELIAKAEKLCPDCGVSDTSFKAIALAKLADGSWDAWVVSSKNKDPRPLAAE